MRVIKAIYVAIVLTLSAAVPAAAGLLEDAVAAYDKGEFATALRLWRRLADQGDVPAQIKVGSMYAEGVGVPRDYVEAMKWFRRAADQGSARAQFDVGTMYDSGQGVPQSFAETVKWYRLAAAQGHADAQYHLGLMHAEGRGVAKSDA